MTEASDLPNHLIRAFILLLLSEEPSHGYELVARLQPWGFTEGRAGSLYRDLRLLEDEGYLTSTWHADQVRGPARRVYTLTAAGRRALTTEIDNVKTLRNTLTRFIKRAEGRKP